ncbi:cobalamin biosynthesis protein CbiN [Bacillus mycoides]|uniref:cobalamin biosynthesis protein CbiN n=1 Tax=Bacillus mycoides TaxID=1405 RepID=UPI001A2F0306|nr:cobalamin biosynthesis protein CbiN [Bacillus mycoides]MBJ7993248.1 cobalamin biosynthesis protein CbiN [Bacillus cereus]MED1402923.1 cobalamin biosynthesis protein CbiN [Bacillus mycoides]QWH86044.1 cobalamin biosynthesis protein CbiN [Bacillus mycoides]QWI97127.1 cobalamin biosynthesis protein CbiN [Bacillus mycoides]UNJ92534.1 cobalamin biosynthesis protein CbiN [Bacillus mycoides]
MKRIVYLLSFVLICSFTFFISSEKSYACDCINVSPEDAFQKNDVVFEGKVLEVQEKDEGGIKTLFEVKKIWKGTSSSQIIIYTSVSSCAFRFAEGGEYLVFSSYRGEEKLETSICSGTQRLDEAELKRNALSHIAKEYVPTKKVNLKGDMVNGFRWGQLVIISIGVLLIIAVVIFIVRRTRKK